MSDEQIEAAKECARLRAALEAAADALDSAGVTISFNAPGPFEAPIYAARDAARAAAREGGDDAGTDTRGSHAGTGRNRVPDARKVRPGVPAPDVGRVGRASLAREQSDEVEAELRRLEADPAVTKSELRLYLQHPMPCGHATGNLLTCSTPPFGCVICGEPGNEKAAAPVPPGPPFLAAYDAWATSPEHCAGPLFDAMVAAREGIVAGTPKPPRLTPADWDALFSTATCRHGLLSSDCGHPACLAEAAPAPVEPPVGASREEHPSEDACKDGTCVDCIRVRAEIGSANGETFEEDEHLPAVGGRRLTTSLATFERKCRILVGEEQRKIAPDTSIVDALCEGVRLAREQADRARESIAAAKPREVAQFETLLADQADLLALLREARGYMRHDPTCAMAQNTFADQCGCGYVAAFLRVVAALGSAS